MGHRCVRFKALGFAIGQSNRIRVGAPKARSRNVSDLLIGLDSFSYLSCVFAARSASVSHRSAISMKYDLCAELRAASANRMHSAALLRN